MLKKVGSKWVWSCSKCFSMFADTRRKYIAEKIFTHKCGKE